MYRPYSCLAVGFAVGLAALAPASTVTASEIHDAVQAGDTARVRQLLSDDKLLANAADDDGAPPLNLAAQNGFTDVR